MSNFHIRTTKTFSKATVVQVVEYVNRKMIIIKHIWSSHSLDQLKKLKFTAMNYIDRLTLLSSASVNYIVEARLANLPLSLIKKVSTKLNRSDGMKIRVKTELGDLICEYSEKRYRKEKREMDSYIKKAESLIKQPGKIRNSKYVKIQNQSYN